MRRRFAFWRPPLIQFETFFLQPSGWIPNNSLPVLVYRGALDATGDIAARFEALFGGNGWPAQWRDGIFDYDHYHSTTHEALGFAAGSARLLIGGPEGVALDFAAGDAALLPAGTGHRKIEASADLVVVGAYPKGCSFDIRRDAPDEHAMARIKAAPYPFSDPVAGAKGPLVNLWQRLPEPRDET